MTDQLDIFNQLPPSPSLVKRGSEGALDFEEERVVSLLREGKENARGVHWLAAMVWVSDVKLREIVRHLIDEHGYCIGSRTGEPAGYYLIKEPGEIDEVYRSLRHRGISILVRASKLKRISLEEVFGQGRLTQGMKDEGLRGIKMTQHYTKNTTAVLAYCPTCNRKTRHRVSDGRQGTCLEHEAKLSKEQERRRERQEEEEKNPRMF